MTVTQLVNPDIDRVDAVNGPATGLPFLMFKSLDAPAAEAEPVEKSAEEAPVAEAPAAEEAPAEEVAKSAEETSEEEAPADEAPVEVEKSADDAAAAAKAAKNLAVIRSVVKELAMCEDEESPYSADAFDLMDAGSAIDYALGVLAKFALTEQLDSAAAATVEKALHLSVHDGEEAPAAPAHAEAPAAPHEEAPAAPAHAPAPAPAKAAAPAEKPLPSGLQEILDTFVESYSRFKEAQDSGAQAALAEDDANDPNATPEVAPAPAAHAAPVAPAEAAPAAAHEEPPAAAPAAPEAPAKPVAPEAAPAAAEAPAEAPAEDPEVPPKKVAKSMDELIAEAVSKAVEEATTPLLKQIDVLGRMPDDSGSPMLFGQAPGNPGNPLQGGQAEGVAKGLGNQSGAPQAAPGAYALADALKGAWGANR